MALMRDTLRRPLSLPSGIKSLIPKRESRSADEKIKAGGYDSPYRRGTSPASDAVDGALPTRTDPGATFMSLHSKAETALPMNSSPSRT